MDDKRKRETFWTWKRDIPLYAGSFHLWVGSGPCLRQHLKMSPYFLDDVERYGHADGSSFGLNPPEHTRYTHPLYVAWLPSWNGSHMAVAHLVHECIHTAMIKLKDAGVRVATSDDEALCYLAQWMVQTALGWLSPKHVLAPLKDVRR